MSSGDEHKAETDLTYETAIQELETILQDLEKSDVDVDLLSTKVSRGNDLIKFCKQRLEKVSAEINTVIHEIEQPQEKAETSNTDN